MALWDPSSDTKIADVEHLGRRRFKRAPLAGFPDEAPKKELTHFDFLDERDPELSVDRLGKNGVDRRVQGQLLPLARANAEKRRPRMVFLGWASIQAKKFLSEAQKLGYSIRPAPTGGASLEENKFHAVISCPATIDRTYVALYLCYLFIKHGGVLDSEPVPQKGILNSVFTWLRGLRSGPMAQ
jgi:hypothetical protein